MKLELELDDDEATRLLDAIVVREPTGTVVAKLTEAIDEARLGAIPSNPIALFLEEFARGIQRARAGRMQPRWEWLRPAIVAIDRTVKSDASYVHNADALGAYVRDTFDALGLSVRDPETLYVALVTASLLVELCSNGVRRGTAELETLEAVAKISQSFAASVIEYLPPEARP